MKATPAICRTRRRWSCFINRKAQGLQPLGLQELKNPDGILSQEKENPNGRCYTHGGPWHGGNQGLGGVGRGQRRYVESRERDHDWLAKDRQRSGDGDGGR